MVHKFYAIKSEKEIGKGAVISTFFALIVAGGSYLLGGGFGGCSAHWTAATAERLPLPHFPTASRSMTP